MLWRRLQTQGLEGDYVALIEVRDLATYYFTSKVTVNAVDGVDLEVGKGEMLGVVGESGSGKTTLALSILKLIEPPGRIVRGQILLNGEDIIPKSEDRMRHIRWKRISLIPQSAMNALNPVFRIGDQIAEPIMEHEQASKREARQRARRLLELVGIDPEREDSYPHELSGGMKQRAVIAMALACGPEIVVADEPTTGLDVMVQAQILGLLKDLQRKLGLSMIFISHDLPIVTEICDKIAVTYAGKVAEYSDTQSLFERPLHPYSKGLMEAFPSVKGPRRKVGSIPGSVPDLTNPPTGCRFHPRCPYAFELCVKVEPKLERVLSRRFSACHLEAR